jgi:hypothetical protein
MILGGSRGCGKTTKLVKFAASEQLYIICANRQRAEHIANVARQLNLIIPYPITAEELPLRSSYIKKVMIDDVEDVLSYLIQKPIYLMSTSMEMLPLEVEEK